MVPHTVRTTARQTTKSSVIEDAGWPPVGWTRQGLLDELFDACDDDGSGALSLQEFSQIYDQRTCNAKAILKIKFDQADSTVCRDQKLTKEEFGQYLQRVVLDTSVSDEQFLRLIAGPPRALPAAARPPRCGSFCDRS